MNTQNNEKGFFKYFPEGTWEICRSMVECWRQSNGGHRNIENPEFFFVFSVTRDSTMTETQVQDCLVENGYVHLLGGLCQD